MHLLRGRLIEISIDALSCMGKSKWIGGIGACTAPKNVLWPEHAKKHGEACSLKHQHLSTSDTALLDALGSYRPESMCLADRQKASIRMAHISIL